jgi:hypothetical protein
MSETKQPELSEEQYRIIYNTLIQATPIGMSFETKLEKLAWYERGEIIQTIKSHFGWKDRRKRESGDPAQGTLVTTGNGNPDPAPNTPDSAPNRADSSREPLPDVEFTPLNEADKEQDQSTPPVEVHRKRGRAVNREDGTQ